MDGGAAFSFHGVDLYAMLKQVYQAEAKGLARLVPDQTNLPKNVKRQGSEKTTAASARSEPDVSLKKQKLVPQEEDREMEEEEEEEEEDAEAMDEEGEDSEETGLYVPEYASKKRRRNGLNQYLVHWKGYPSTQDTWEFASDKIDPKTKEPGNLPVEYLDKTQHPKFAQWSKHFFKKNAL